MKVLINSLVRGTSAVMFFAPAFVRRALAHILAFIWWDLLRIRRKVVFQNLDIAFPEKSLAEKKRIARESLVNLGLSVVEYAYFPWINQRNVDEIFIFEGLETLDAVLARGKGALFLTLHMGNGDLAVAAFALKGYTIVLVSKLFKAKWLNDLWFGMREKAGVKFLPPRDSSFAILKALKRGAIMVFPLDQFTGPPIGVRTRFFGRETGTAAGLAVMAKRSGTPVLLVNTVRDPDGKHRIRILREVPISLEESDENTTQRFNGELEELVREHPEQWMWIHRRWKKFKF